MNSIFCLRGRELLQELKRAEWLSSFDDEGVRSILQEIDILSRRLEAKKQELEKEYGGEGKGLRYINY